MRLHVSQAFKLGLALLLSSAVALSLFATSALKNQDLGLSFFVWNLFLAWLPLIFAWWLVGLIRRRRWTNWLALVLTLLWLGFLPNSFYMLTDFIHIYTLPRADFLFDVIMLSSFILTGMALGFTSLYLVHKELVKRLNASASSVLVALVLFLSSFAIYVGRDLRWNTWDILVNPASMLVDVSERILHPLEHPNLLSVTLGVFALLSGIYLVVWYALKAVRQSG